MTAVNLALPAELVSAAKLDQGNVSRDAAKLIALELFHEGTVSLGRAAELCDTPRPHSWTLRQLMVCRPSTTAWSSWKRTGAPWQSSARDGCFRLLAAHHA